jgi:hypothetical protein
MIHSADGQVPSVRYLMLTGMLLNELQKQALEMHNQSRENAKQTAQIKRLSAQVADERTQVADERAQRAAFEQRFSNLERTIQAKNGDGKLVAAR